MPHVLFRLLLTIVLLGASAILPAHAVVAGEPVVLNDLRASFDISTPVQTWLEPGAKASITNVAASPALFLETAATSIQPLSEHNTLWIKLRLQREPESRTAWTLNLPLPDLDSVSMYQRDEAGNWTVQSSGDRVMRMQWAKNGLYPEFDVNIPAGVAQDVYLQVRNARPISLPLWLATGSEREFVRLLEFMTLGVLLGTTLMLTMLSVGRFVQHRNPADALALVYCLLVALAAAQVNGVLNALLWVRLPTWADYATAIIPLLTCGFGLLLARKLFALSARHPRFDQFLIWLGGASMASVLGYALLNRMTADALAIGVWLVANTSVMLAALLSWRSGAPAGRWLALAFLPQYLGALRLVAEVMGLVPAWWELRYLLTLFITLSVPVLVYALSRATHDRKELEVRADHLTTQDALTGLLSPNSFIPLVHDAYARAVQQREPVALVLVNVVNLEFIRETYGDTTAEQCLLRAVVKLQRVLRDVDPAGRLDTAQLGVLIEGASDEEAVSERMVRLIASGLVPLPGLEPEVTLHFQVACLLMHRNPIPAERALSELEELLQSMTPRTRRPIRFVDAPATVPLAQEL